MSWTLRLLLPASISIILEFIHALPFCAPAITVLFSPFYGFQFGVPDPGSYLVAWECTIYPNLCEN